MDTFEKHCLIHFLIIYILLTYHSEIVKICIFFRYDKHNYTVKIWCYLSQFQADRWITRTDLSLVEKELVALNMLIIKF